MVFFYDFVDPWREEGDMKMRAENLFFIFFLFFLFDLVFPVDNPRNFTIFIQWSH